MFCVCVPICSNSKIKKNVESVSMTFRKKEKNIERLIMLTLGQKREMLNWCYSLSHCIRNTHAPALIPSVI